MDGTFVAPRRLLPKLREIVSAYRSWQFDFYHGVITRATKADEPDATRDNSSGFWYLPTWPQTAQAALVDLPVTDLSTYTFVDFGSGKGRILLMALKLPFRHVLGIELDDDLHRQAERNLSNYRNLPQLCADVKSVHMDALDYDFPQENLVLYFFNPFGPTILEKVLAKLEISLETFPRDVIALFVHPEHAYVFERSSFFTAYEKTESCYKYRTKR